jgi:hypothetical protein
MPRIYDTILARQVSDRTLRKGSWIFSLRSVNHPWGGTRSGKSDRYFEPPFGRIESADFAAVKSNSALRDGQAQPNAPGLSFPRLVEPEKRAKQLLQRRLPVPQGHGRES